MGFEALGKPIKLLFGIGNALVWVLFCGRLILRWHVMPVQSHWSGISLAIIFPLLWESLLRDKDKSSHLFYATGAFLATIFAVYPLF
jgi:hypothetical protein